MADDLQRKIQSELEIYKSLQKEYSKAVQTRQQLDGQLNENQIVKDELNILREDSAVYKSVGPILIKTDLVEAKQNVAKRMDYIGKEMKRIDDQILNIEKKQDGHREILQKLQHQFQQAQVKAAMKA
ncbi:prefoldin subunit 6 [Holotrichia oblita]|uniref:Prefoldin subunit 6 n=3 Tax=Holotrichia oblita TaxID=644536 RepID=A0ACB9TS64_HOLOL|nr:prefoldin subunit 6 [Holotrichia oblita]KAI4469634.1 prefoldin subunit 6 [Holotrichia oblita]KAI4469643.1 prefoldin subunit 6 [Holotrichia oblita]